MSSIFDSLRLALESNQLVALATIVDVPNIGAKLLVWPDGRTQGGLGGASLDQSVLDSALGLLSGQKTARRTFEVAGETSDVFIEVFPPPPRLIVVGAVHVAIPLLRFANELGFHTVIVDPRRAFATLDRFAHADQIIRQWPDDALAELALDEGCYIAILSHDDKLDVPALKVALSSRARYIGALGSRKTMAGRAQKLREMGISDEQLARVYNPIGLNLGGRRPEEIALAIMAEIVGARNGQTAGCASRFWKDWKGDVSWPVFKPREAKHEQARSPERMGSIDEGSIAGIDDMAAAAQPCDVYGSRGGGR